MIFKIFKLNNQGSAVLFLTVIVLATILTVVLTASDIVRNGLSLDKTQLDSTKAYFTAEAAAERILWQTRKNADFTCSPPGIICIHFGNNSDPGVTCDANCAPTNAVSDALSDYTYYIKYSTSGADTKLTCYGNYKGLNRAVEILY